MPRVILLHQVSFLGQRCPVLLFFWLSVRREVPDPLGILCMHMMCPGHGINGGGGI